MYTGVVMVMPPPLVCSDTVHVVAFFSVLHISIFIYILIIFMNIIVTCYYVVHSGEKILCKWGTVYNKNNNSTCSEHEQHCNSLNGGFEFLTTTALLSL